MRRRKARKKGRTVTRSKSTRVKRSARPNRGGRGNKKYTRTHTEKSVLYNLFQKFSADNKYFCRNKYIFEGDPKGWESDGFMVSPSGFSTEFEVKVTASDVAKEAKAKELKHTFLRKVWETKGEYLKNPAYKEGSKQDEFLYTCPNYFIYVCQEGLIQPEYIEENYPYAGLKWVTDKGVVKTKVRKKLHGVKQDLGPILLNKFYYATNFYDYETYSALKEFKKMGDERNKEEYLEFIKDFFKKLKIR